MTYGGHKLQVCFKEFQIIRPIHIVPDRKKLQRHAIWFQLAASFFQHSITTPRDTIKQID